jgi:hypothetical protein
MKHERSPGRPPGDGPIDWSSPESVRKYFQEYRDKRRADIQVKYKAWKDKNPDYFKQYYKANSDKILAAQARWRKKKSNG